ncbi:MAG: ABC transporter permease [Lachnospiraceae bacterium]|nr:ABC transporter permease [Lachnospiraceae bacterium]
MEYLKTVFTKVYIRLLIAAGICVAVGLILVAIGVHSAASLKDQQIASRWGDKKDFAEVSVFFSELAGFKEEGVTELKYKISEQLRQDSLTREEDGVRTWVYAYSANGKANITFKKNTAEVKVIGVGGDFFLFHPIRLVNGSYFDDSYLMKDLVVLDEETAANLFGSSDCVGQIVEIGGVMHVVSGVIKKDESRLDKLAGNNEPTIFMSYEALEANGMASYISSYEALLPNPITSYAMNTVKDVLKIDEKRYEMLENTSRFKWTNLLKRVPKYGTWAMNSKGVIYPYWENMARGMEDYLTPVALLVTILFAYPSVLLLVVLIRMWKKRTIHRGDVKNFFEDRVEDYRGKRRKRDGELEIYEIT